MKYLDPWWFDKSGPNADTNGRKTCKTRKRRLRIPIFLHLPPFHFPVSKNYRTTPHGIILKSAALALFFVVNACAAVTPIPSNHLREGSSDPIEKQLRAEAEHWKAVRHRLGGIGSTGVDCSGFVMMIYDKLFGIHLPRTTEKLARIGSSVPKSRLQPGDLVFFMPGRNNGHVGIYLNNGEFVHASTRRGVTISRMNTPYWRNAYWTSRRVLSTEN